MSRPIRPVLLAVLLGSIFPFGHRPALAQVGGNVPVVIGVFPPGVTVGETQEWTITGRNLLQVKKLLISGEGVEVVEFQAKDQNTATARIKIARTAEAGFRELRLDGPNGISNLAIVRIDRLKQILEIEPNDSTDQAQPVEVGMALTGVLKELDRDHFRIKGNPGQKVTIDLEARRLGNAISPVLTIFSSHGDALAQGRESRGPDHDCVMSVTLPGDGICVVQVRDNTYGGNDQARYRLRIDPAPFATAIFPIGGIRGQTLDLEISGGSLNEPLRKSIPLPDAPGSMIEPGSIESPGGPILIPGRIVVEDGPEEIFEPSRRVAESPIEVKAGVTVNGRISQPGEIDSYRISAKKGEKLRVKVEASALGSWLDSVLVLRDAKAATLAENDDATEAVRANQARSVSALGVPLGSSDSSLEYEVKEDGWITIELTDRFGDGGPEYAYRLAIGHDRPDFSVNLLLGNATENTSSLTNIGQTRTIRTSPGQFGVFNLKAGGSVPINFIVAPEGRPGPIEVSVEGLPDGVTAEPVVIRFPGPKSTTTGRADPVGDFLTLKVARFAQPGLGELRVIARARPSPGLVITREALAMIGIDSSNVSGRPITRVVHRIPLRIIGETKPRFVGPPAPTRLLNVGVPGPLLQGDQLDLKLEFDGSVNADDGSSVEAVARGIGLATNTVISAGTSLTDAEPEADVVVHVLASTKAQPGPHPMTVSYTPRGGPTSTLEVMVDVKSPIEVRPSAETIFLRPGDHATLKVDLKRESGFNGEVEIKLEDLPRGVKPPKSIELAGGANSIEIKLEMSPQARPIAKPVAVRVVGMARMPRGNVLVESQIKPMIEARPADK